MASQKSQIFMTCHHIRSYDFRPNMQFKLLQMCMSTRCNCSCFSRPYLQDKNAHCTILMLIVAQLQVQCHVRALCSGPHRKKVVKCMSIQGRRQRGVRGGHGRPRFGAKKQNTHTHASLDRCASVYVHARLHFFKVSFLDSAWSLD